MQDDADSQGYREGVRDRIMRYELGGGVVVKEMSRWRDFNRYNHV